MKPLIESLEDINGVSFISPQFDRVNEWTAVKNRSIKNDKIYGFFSNLNRSL